MRRVRQTLRKYLVLMIGVLPKGQVKNFLLNLLGYKIDRSVKFGPCLILNVKNISISKHSRIGPFNVFRDLQQLTFKSGSVLGQFNWITASSVLVTNGAPGSLILGEESAITSRHYLDCSGGISIGKFSTVAGVRSTFFTHGIDWKTSTQRWQPIQIGNFCLLGSNLSVCPNTEIPDNCVVGMGSTISGKHTSQNKLMIGVRAISLEKNVDGLYFTRKRGPV